MCKQNNAVSRFVLPPLRIIIIAWSIIMVQDFHHSITGSESNPSSDEYAAAVRHRHEQQQDRTVPLHPSQLVSTVHGHTAGDQVVHKTTSESEAEVKVPSTSSGRLQLKVIFDDSAMFMDITWLFFFFVCVCVCVCAG